MHNYYTYLYNQTVFELLERKRGKGQAVLFARSATAGGQKFPVHWGGDCWSSYESMGESLRGGLSLQMSGFGFWSHDIGGFEGGSNASADIYKRWCAFGLLSSHSRLHGSGSYRVPWNYDDEAVDVLRFFSRWKARLMPYIWKTAMTAHETGIPSMRAMVLEFESDRNIPYLDKQYMLGDSLLVAPIFNEEGTGEYYLPQTEGCWTDFFTGEQQQGGTWYSRHYGYQEIPLMVRPNSIIPVGASEEGPEYDYAKDLTFRVYNITSEAEASVYRMDQTKAAELTASKSGDKELALHLQGAEDCCVVIYNQTAASVEGADFTVEDGNTILTNCNTDVRCRF